MTTLTVTRRNVVPLNFATTTLIPGSAGNATYSYALNTPYMQISSVAGDGFGLNTTTDPAGPPNYPERYSFLCINDSGHEFGAYYDTEVRTDAGAGGFVALSRDKSTWTMHGFNAAESSAVRLYYKSITADMDNVVLSDPRIPSTGHIDFPSGYSRGNALYPVHAVASVANVVATTALNDDSTSYRIFTTDGTEYKAFVVPVAFYPRANQLVTLNDGTFNYTLVDSDPVSGTGNSVYMSKWTAETTGNAFSQTDYTIALSDGADDAIFQASADTNFADFRLIRGNYESFIYAIVSSSVFPLTSATAFVFAKDFSWYDRIDIVADGQLSFGTYFQDIDGTHFLTGEHVSAGCEAFQLASGGSVGGAGDGTVDDSVVIRSWGFKLDGHTHIVWRLGPDKTLIFDRQTRMWSRYVSPGRNCWRAHVGQNWLGMASTTFASGFGSDVVAGDDASGVLWILDPTTGLDDRSTTGSDPFIRVVVGGVEASGRQSIPCNAVQMDIALGSPSLTGAAITLETSDDFGHTWSGAGSITVPAGAYGQTVEWRSLGQIVDPGRIFRFSDNGATVRVSGADMR